MKTYSILNSVHFIIITLIIERNKELISSLFPTLYTSLQLRANVSNHCYSVCMPCRGKSFSVPVEKMQKSENLAGGSV